MSSDAHGCCPEGRMREGRHDSARDRDEIIVIKDVPALICDICGEVEYMPEVSEKIDVIVEDYSGGGAAGGKGADSMGGHV